ncbi:Protein Aster-A, partial [Pseudolycoriella hygida]
MSQLLESSDSGNEKAEEFVNDAECTSPAHEWRKLVNIILPVNVEALRNELFMKSKFMDDFHETRKHYDLSCTDWERSEEGDLRRTIKYKMPLSGTMGFGPKYSLVTQVQTQSPCCVPNRLYVVDVVNSNENIPYAENFEVVIHHCILSTIDDHSMYSVFGQVRYKKSVWGVVKSRIDKNCLAGMDDFFGGLQETLQKELCTPPSKGKRSSRKKFDSTSLTLQTGNSQNVSLDPQTISSKVSDSIKPGFLIWLIFGVLIAVITLNTVLLFKLWVLERELSIEAMPDYDTLSFLSQSVREYLELGRSIPGRPGTDYPILSAVPYTNFYCDDQPYPGFFADMDTRCQGWHYCDIDGRQASFLCPNGTQFSQAVSIERSSEEWMRLLRNQQNIHEAEVTKWLKVIEVAITLIQNTEKTLVELLAQIQLQEIIEAHSNGKSHRNMQFLNENKSP